MPATKLENSPLKMDLKKPYYLMNKNEIKVMIN